MTNTHIIEQCVPESVWKEFNSKLEEGRVKRFVIENKAVYCKNCMEIFSATLFTYELSEGGSSKYIAPCPECGKKAHILDNIKSIVCPKCGRKMTAEPTGHWD